jgi:hypothetical protein
VTWEYVFTEDLALSKMENEFIAAYEITKEVVGLDDTVLIFVDNQPAIRVCKNLEHYEKTRQTDIRYSRIRAGNQLHCSHHNNFLDNSQL